MEEESQHQASLTISALGWVLAVLLFAVALFGGKPYVQHQGYDAGRKEAAEKNAQAIDQVVKKRVIEGDNYVVFGKVESVSGNAVRFETINPYLINPLSKQTRYQVATVSADTIIEKRTLLSPEAMAKALEDGRKKGLKTEDIQVHVKEPLTIDMLKVGDELRFYPTVAQDAVNDTFAVKQILLVISTQNPTNQPAQ